MAMNWFPVDKMAMKYCSGHLDQKQEIYGLFVHPTSQAQSKVLQNLIQDLQRTDLSAFDNINQYHLPSHRAPASSTPINSHTSHSHVPTDMQQRARKSLVFGQGDQNNTSLPSYQQGTSSLPS
jgi:hypothetical protein